MTSETINVRVASKILEADDIVSFELVHPNDDLLPSFEAGSHIDVHIGENLMRQYSLCNDPQERHRYLIGVLKESEGRGGSVAMHETLQEGDLVKISHPRNSFHLLEDAEHTILLAGGIGVTPIMAMAQRLSTLGKNFDLHYCARSLDRCAFRNKLQNSPFADQVQFHFDDGEKEQLLDIPGLLKDYREGTNIYVCGPKGFIDAVVGNSEPHWPEGTVHREYFSADPSAGHDDDKSFEVKIVSSGQTYTIPSGKSIAETLDEYGINIPISCEQGICGTCLVDVVEGVPEHRDSYLSDAEREANDQLTCCCSRSKSEVLVLDL